MLIYRKTNPGNSTVLFWHSFCFLILKYRQCNWQCMATKWQYICTALPQRNAATGCNSCASLAGLVLQYVLLQLLVIAAVISSFKIYCKFYCKFYFTCELWSLLDSKNRRCIDALHSDEDSLSFVVVTISSLPSDESCMVKIPNYLDTHGYWLNNLFEVIGGKFLNISKISHIYRRYHFSIFSVFWYFRKDHDIFKPCQRTTFYV